MLTNHTNEDIDDNNRKFSLNFAEIIGKYIVDKLISFAITESNSRELDKQLGNHCFLFLKNFLNKMISMNYISYEREDYKVNHSILKEQEEIFYSNRHIGLNDWSCTYEPVNNY